MADFVSGLEGVVAVETEIAEPDREGGALRYRGIDIEELAGALPFERVWGILVDGSPKPGLTPAPPVALETATGDALADLQGATALLGGRWRLGKLIDVSDTEARDDLARVSAAMISLTAQAARAAAGLPAVEPAVVARGGTMAERLLLEW